MRNRSVRRGTATSTSSTKTPCCSKLGLKRGPWTPEEDELLANYINKEGEGRWRTLPKRAGLLRCGKSCRLRWMNYLRPCVKRGQIAPDEEDLILRLHRLLGNRWSLIAGRIPGRTDNEIKNYWNTHLSKKLISQGIDPRTHKPFNYESVDDQHRASSSKPVNATRRTSSPKRKNNDTDNNLLPASSSAVEETASETTQMIVSNEENLCFGSTSFDQYDAATIADDDNNFASLGFTGFLSCEDGSAMDVGNNIHGINNKETDINYCNEFGTDDAFSSFLNSLINEEVFSSQQQHDMHNGIIPSTDPVVSINASTFGFAPGWESAGLVSFVSHRPY